MANKSVAGRLRGVPSLTDDSGGYDLLGHLRDAGTFVATGQMPVRASASTSNSLADRIALEEVKARLKSQNVNPLNDQLKQAQIAQANAEAESYKQPLPASLIRVGKSVVNNPDYIDPIEQARLDEMNRKQEADNLKIQEAQVAKENAEKAVKDSAQNTLNTIQNVRKGKDFFGPFGNMPSLAAPSSLVGQYGPRKDWENNINNLLSNKVVDVMTSMKRASKTGATGFGQLSNKELDLLRNASTTISRDLPPDKAMEYLTDLENIQKKILGQPTVEGGSMQSGDSPLPSVGQTFQGKKVLSVKRIA